jgi:hypothetical protein
MSKYVGFIPAPELFRSFGVSDRTGFNWEARGILPKPKRINGRKYFPVGTVPKFDDMPDILTMRPQVIA